MEPEDVRERSFVAALAAGRAVLLLGQNHSPALLSQLLSDIAAAQHSEKQVSLRRQLVDRVGPDDLTNVRRALSLHSPPESLLDLTRQPWSIVLTSAVDTVATEALRQATSSGRRLRFLSPSQTAGQLTRSSPNSLTAVRLFGSLEEQEERYLPPFTSRELRQRQRFDVAALLNQLPDHVGPHGCLTVVGVDSEDWLDLGDLALACSNMPADSVHWFGDQVPDDVRDDFGDVLVFHSGTVGELLSRRAQTAEGRALQHARTMLVRPSSRALTLAPAGVTPIQVHLTPEDWRNVSQVGVLLDDTAVIPPKALGPDETREAFRIFLRGQQYVPDWEGIARGFLFEREKGDPFVHEIEGALSRLGSVHDWGRNGGHRGRPGDSRLPLLLTGPPACGKSRLLHWLAYQLRQRGHAVLYLVTPAGRVHYESVERVVRVIEGKGAPGVLVFADGLDEASYRQLNEHLASSGRNAVLIGTRTSSTEVIPDDPRKQSGFTQFRALEVLPRLTASEFDRFATHLAKHGFGDVKISPELVSERYFLLLLYRLLPDARGNIHISLVGAYDRLLSTLDKMQEAEDLEASNSQWMSQLKDVRLLLFPDADEGSEDSSPLTHVEGVERAVNLCLFCSQIGKPLPLDLLLRTQDRGFLRKYRELAVALESTGLLHEVPADNVDTIVLDADHAVVAQLTLASVMPRRSDQLRLLQSLVDAVAWDESAFPGDRPDQDYCIEVLQAVGPRGVSEREFGSPPALEVVAELLASVRVNSARLPKLLLLEANTLRILADRLAADYETGLRRCSDALAVLDVAEQILLARRPTGARNSELRNVLNTRATVRGFVVGNLLRAYGEVTGTKRDEMRSQIFAALADVDHLAARSRGLGDSSFYPLDVTFWVYRDVFDQLPDLTEEERLRLLERMEAVLDAVDESPIESNQMERFQRRAVNLAQLEGNLELSETLATSMRLQGDFSGECLLVRRQVFEPGTRQAKSRTAALTGLNRLESFGVSVFGSPEALDLMNHLWRSAYLPDANLSGPDPVFARCSAEEWLRWRRVLEARIRLVGSGQNVFLGFCLSWALFELEEPRLALHEIRAVEPLSGGNRRRVGCLVVLSDAEGKAIRYRAAVRRREGDAIVTYVTSIGAELRLPPAMVSRFAVLPQVGDELDVEVGLNYRGLLPWRLP